jgi:hypothetical protein
MSQQTPATRLAGFLEKYEPGVAKLARGALATVRKRIPGAFELVYGKMRAGHRSQRGNFLLSKRSPMALRQIAQQQRAYRDPHETQYGYVESGQ